ncbi:MAG: hypothetical protein AAB393_17695, partial [Bacteroidota bacterium]
MIARPFLIYRAGSKRLGGTKSNRVRLLYPLSCIFIFSCSSTPQLGKWQFTGGPYAQNISTVFVDEHNKSHLLVGLTSGEVFSSINEGVSWNKLSAIEPGNAIHRFIQHPEDPRRLYAATDSGVFISTNAGMNWSELVIDSIHTRTSSRILAIEPYNTQVMYAGLTGRGIYKTTDGGRSWHTGNSGLDSLALMKSDVFEIRIDPSKPDNLYAAFREIGVVKSTDGGTSWVKLTSIMGSSGVAPTSIVVNPKTPSMLCFGMEAGSIYKSVDGGQTWSPTRFGSASSKPVSLALHPANSNTIYAGTENDLLVSTDFGTTWKSIANELPHVATSLVLAPGEPHPTIYAYGEGIGVRRSTDNGASWQSRDTKLGGSTVAGLAVSKRGNAVYAVSGSSVHKWTVETNRWISASNGLTGGAISSLTIDTDTSAIVHVATTTGVFSTADGGNSWSPGSPQMRGKSIGFIATHPIFATR